MQKKRFYTELAYIIGLLTLAFSTAMMTKADFGLSMVVAPAYLLHAKLYPTLPFFTFGMAEYIFQAALLLLMICIVRRFRVKYIFAFVTAVLYGLLLDLSLSVLSFLPTNLLAVRILLFVVGLVVCSFGVACMFHTYLAPEVYELFVKEVSDRYHFSISKCKTVYDCASCLLAIVLSFAFFGFGTFIGVKWGTVVCALVNGFLIGRISAFLEKHFSFVDLLKRK
ncbi:MAG: hypothetical protein J6K61_05320 [Clostridia bacterium]|nr:hypothetical protein [Clostridia bacterium]